MVDIKRIDDRAHDGISTGNIRKIVSDQDPQAETVRSVVGMADFADKRHPFPDRGITTKGYQAFENDKKLLASAANGEWGLLLAIFLLLNCSAAHARVDAQGSNPSPSTFNLRMKRQHCPSPKVR